MKKITVEACNNVFDFGKPILRLDVNEGYGTITFYFDRERYLPETKTLDLEDVKDMLK